MKTYLEVSIIATLLWLMYCIASLYMGYKPNLGISLVIGMTVGFFYPKP